MARAEARQVAMQLIYEQMLGGEGGDQTILELLGFSPSLDDAEYLEDVVSGILGASGEIDGRIEKNLVGWTLDRLARVDLAIMRVAAYEMLYRKDVPAPVAINEAVELSHRFSTDEAGGFINGVLGSIARQEVP